MYVLLAANKAAEELAKVKAGLEGGDSLPQGYLLWLLAGLLVIIAIGVLSSLARRRRDDTGLFRGWASINEPNRISVLLKRAAARQAECTLEIFDHQHTDVYRGHVYEASPGERIILELSRQAGQDIDFDGFPAQVHLNFRPAPKEPMEHYQFSTRTISFKLEPEKNWRVPRLSVSWPHNIISAQRRDFLRVEPAGEHAINLTIFELPTAASDIPDRLASLAEGTVLDISVGGIHIVCPGIPPVMEGRKALIGLELPLSSLDLSLRQIHMYLELSILSHDIISPSSNDEGRPGSMSHTLIRAVFTGRYRPDDELGGWHRLDFSTSTFQDLAHWIHAYQRFLLKKEKGLLPKPIDRVNAFPAIPPVREGNGQSEG